MTTKRPIHIIFYGYNKTLDCAQTTARYAKILETYRETPGATIIVPSYDQNGTIIHDQLRKDGVPESRIIFCPKGRHTLGETLIAIKATPDLLGTKVIVVSSWYHLPRIIMLWHVLASKAVDIRVAYGGEREEEPNLEKRKFQRDFRLATIIATSGRIYPPIRDFLERLIA